MRCPMPGHPGIVDQRCRRGCFVGLDSSGITLTDAAAGTVRVPMSDVVCLQVPRRTVGAGVASGFSIGAVAGFTGAIVFSYAGSDADSRRDDFAFGAVALTGLGELAGSLIGAAVKGTSWDTALDRSR